MIRSFTNETSVKKDYFQGIIPIRWGTGENS
jgi:hypothetical protein